MMTHDEKHARYDRYRYQRLRVNILDYLSPTEFNDALPRINEMLRQARLPELQPLKETKMTNRQFFDRVVQLRRFQKEFFATRSRESLQQAKALEKEIDDEITRVQKILAAREQQQSPNLFNQ